MADTTLRPDRTSMEGMIWNANHILELALDPKTNGVPKDLFKKCVGIAIVSTIEAGFVFSGNVGTGILLKKMPDGSWSPPVALGLTGVGWGFIVGGQIKDTISFILDENSMAGMLGEVGVRLSGQAAITLGPFGRNIDAGVGISNAGATGIVTTSFSRGVFGGLSVEGAGLGVRTGVNDTFYGRTTTPRSIVSGEVKLPENKPTLIDAVYEKLAKLGEGQTGTPTEAEASMVLQAAASAQQASDAVNQSSPDVVKVDAAAEAAKASM